MAGNYYRSVSLVFLILIVVVDISNGENTTELDGVWQKRAVEAKEAALHAYEPNPTSVTDHLNGEVHR